MVWVYLFSSKMIGNKGLEVFTLVRFAKPFLSDQKHSKFDSVNYVHLPLLG